MRRAEGAADRMIDKDRPRRGDFAHDIVRGADHQSRNASGFDHVSDETDGLVAERSIGNEQSEVDFRLLSSGRWPVPIRFQFPHGAACRP